MLIKDFLDEFERYKVMGEKAIAQVPDAARKAIEAAAARGVRQVHHLHAAVVVERPVEYRAARGTHARHRRRSVEVVVFREQPAVLKVVQHG